jgi:hypothetical protein
MRFLEADGYIRLALRSMLRQGLTISHINGTAMAILCSIVAASTLAVSPLRGTPLMVVYDCSWPEPPIGFVDHRLVATSYRG